MLAIRHLPSAILFAAALFGTIALLELAALAGLVDWRVAFRTGIALSATGRPWMSDHHRPDDELVWAHRAGVTERLRADTTVWPDLNRGVRELAVMRYDRRGFRNPRELNRADIALVGDSFLDWPLLADSDLVWHRLGVLTSRTVVNLGSPGYGPQQEAEVVRRHVPVLAPRVVLWLFFEGNDLEDVARYEAWQRDYPPAVRSGRGFRVRGFLPNARRRLLMLRRPAPARDEDSTRRRSCVLGVPGTGRPVNTFIQHPLRPLGEEQRRALAVTESSLTAASAVTRRSGASFVLVYVPAKIRVYGERCVWPPDALPLATERHDLPASLGAWATRAGVPFIDLTPALRAVLERGRLPYFEVDAHWNADGHAAAADTLTVFLREWAR